LLGSVRRALPAALVRGGAAVFAVLALLAWTAVPASAHAALQETKPANGSALDTPPETVRLRFNQSMLGIGVTVRVTGPDGSVTAGPPTVKAKLVTQRLQPNLTPGAYRVTWRVASGDGHPISGASRFTITAADPTPASTTITAAPSPTPDVTPSPIAAPDVIGTDTTDDSNLPVIMAAGVGVIALGVLITGAVLLRRRRPGPMGGHRPTTDL
jgi:methionine-rich copper-binding protein CopC